MKKKEHKEKNVVKTIKESYDILVIGSGGTGTNFLRDFNRFIARDKGAQSVINSLTIADGDSVEEKNLDRQCFLEEDLGRNKAAVFAEILNDTLDTLTVSNFFHKKWQAHCSYITDVATLKEHFVHKPEEYSGSNKTLTLHIPVIIGCVDNDGARLVCEQFFEESEYCFYYDAGNEMSSGEVVFAHKFKGQVLSPVKSCIFPQMKTGDTRQVTEFSCQELNQSVPQHFLTNVLAGQLLFTGMVNLYTEIKEKNVLQRISKQLGYTMFDAFTMYQEFIPYAVDTLNGKKVV